MKRIVVLLGLIFLWSSFVYAEDRHTFYEHFNPTSSSWVYTSSASGDATGDVADVFTYDKKTIFINCLSLGSTSIQYRIEGRSVGEIDGWSILDTGEFGTASADTAKNIAIDVTELVDFIRVGLRVQQSNAIDLINIRGIFRKSN